MSISAQIKNPKEDILLNEYVINITDNFLSRDKIPHAILFSGNEWVGKLHNSLFFAKKLLSYSGKKDDSSFNILEEVDSLVDKFSHPDLLYISKSDSKKGISVDHIRNLTKFLSLTPSKGRYRVAIINPAEDLNINSANALLKELEEPINNTVIILICHNKHKLIDTIKSRCLCLDFKNLTEEIYLNSPENSEFSKDKLKEVQKISNNSPYIAKEILSSDVINLCDEFMNITISNVINISKVTKIAKKLDEDFTGRTKDNFYKLLLSEESNKIKNGTKSNLKIDNWFNLLSIYNNSKKSNLDTQDCLKEIINIIKYN